ncbi:hypothetical protein Cri9333_1374 [Crinalium epipsammum PCC 9333]|uniref:Uncharacterized protein n=1 Tax=Crinalium epipsammum PCC 9333 TaxID=1173022 RepID=K9VXJ0_9CYAN|nr:hypothetical protein [Crinalium epipsammum]AFZ12269.1 hypothetical protein Cri9333_1374 [Crinalium epipsammum PCC 9333]
MLQGIWKSLVNGFQGLFGVGNTQKSTALLLPSQPLPPLEDADYEYLLMQLIEGVAHGWQQQRILKFFDALEYRTTQEEWLAWLRRFGDRLLTSSVPNNDLAARMVQLGEIGCGEIGVMAYDIGMQLLTRQNPTDQTWDLDSPQVVYVDAEEMTLEQSFDDWNDSNPDLIYSEIEESQQPPAKIDSPPVIYVDGENTTEVNPNLDPWNDSSVELVSSETPQSQQTSVQIDSPQVIYVDAEKITDVNPNVDPWNDTSPDLVSPQTEESQPPAKLDSPQVIYVDAEKTTDVNPNIDPWNDYNPDLLSQQTEESQEFSIDELLFMLEQNPALAKEMSEQLQINNTNPEAILEAFIQQLDKDIQAQADESQN